MQDGKEEGGEQEVTTVGSMAIRETPDGDIFVGFAPKAQVLDMPPGLEDHFRAEPLIQAVTIKRERLVELLNKAGCNGKNVTILGHVVVTP